MLPQIKKRLKSFILEEEGKISKQSVLKIGSVLVFSILGSANHVFGGCGCGCAPDPCAGGGGSGGSCGCTSSGSSCSCSCGCSCD